jgi:alpha,alpha-trehalase
MTERRPLPSLPSAWERRAEIRAFLGDRLPALFLDFDGTLTPLAARPEQVALPEATRGLLGRLLDCCPVVVVTGRGVSDVRARTGLDGLIYAGSHGFDIDGPRELSHQHPEARRLLPRLDSAQHRLEEALDPVSGAQVERKRFSIAAHYRNVAPRQVGRVERAVEAVLEDHPHLRRRGGKKVLEVQPDVDWDKGRAVAWLLDALGLDGPEVMPVYVGDDLTDEDALELLARRPGALGITVGGEPRLTWGRYRLADPAEVARWLEDLLTHLEGRGSAS